jgi:hypothetical protein
MHSIWTSISNRMEHAHMAKIAAGQNTLTAGHAALLDKPGRDFWSETLTAVI